MKDQFLFDSKLKSGLLITMVIGAVLFGVGSYSAGNIYRAWAVILHNSLFFTLVALASVFFITAHTLAYGGYFNIFRRVPESISRFVTVGGGILFLLMILLVLDAKGIFHTGISHLYHWMQAGITDPSATNFDKIITFKSGFLNLTNFVVLTIIFVGAWIFFARRFCTISLNEDKEGGLQSYDATRINAALFAILFAVSSSVFAWIWLMSINPHWYSTLYGWYCFASFWVSGISVICLICIFLKERGYLEYMNENHFHDLGKFMFGFSVFWTYLWFSQYMLIWYANIPEETAYFNERFHGYKYWFFINLIINFVVPFLFLMKRANKRSLNRLRVIGTIIIFGHWLDYYLLVIPGSLRHNGGGDFNDLWLAEIGFVTFIIGLFLYTTFSYLSRVPMYAKNHPFIKESLTHQI